MFLNKCLKGFCGKDIIFAIIEVKIWDKNRTDCL